MKATVAAFVDPQTNREAVAVAVCARSRQHSGGEGSHDAAVYGACSLHEQMADEMAALLPTDLYVDFEWGFSSGWGKAYLPVGGGEEAVRRLVEDDPETMSVASRVRLLSRRDGHLIDSGWQSRP